MKQDKQTVICVFERDLEDVDKSQLIQIFESHDDALNYIENNLESINLFWEPWQLTKRRNG